MMVMALQYAVLSIVMTGFGPDYAKCGRAGQGISVALFSHLCGGRQLFVRS